MFKLAFLLRLYALPFYRRLAVLTAVGAAATVAASFTAWAGTVALVYALFVGAITVIAATLGVTVANAMVAAALHRGIERFEAAYDTYRRANNIPDLFYEEMDLAEAAERKATLS
jgi:hypothetical protein